MKRCPTCNKTFTDRNLSFCIDDGTPLISVDTSADEVTRVSPSSGTSGNQGNQSPPYIAPPPYVLPGTTANQSKRKVWPWVLGILALLLLLLIGMGIAAAIFLPKMIEGVTNENSRVNSNTNRNRSSSNQNTSNSNSNAGDTETNSNSDLGESKPAPTDEPQVLAELTELEHEWTVPNINADKKALERILADDYVGDDVSGNTHGKAEYLRTIERDTSIQKWEFEDLKVDLNGDRAALSGTLRLQVNDKPQVFRFTDKFVWREGRWQAVGSKVSPVTGVD